MVLVSLADFKFRILLQSIISLAVFHMEQFLVQRTGYEMEIPLIPSVCPSDVSRETFIDHAFSFGMH